MSKLIHILLGPYYFLFGENGLFPSSSVDQNKTQRLYMGIPSLLFAALGVLFLIVGELSAGKSLIQKYEDEIANFDEEVSKLTATFSQEYKELKASKTKNTAGIEKLTQVGIQVNNVLDAKQILLSKLNSLAPEQPQHLYQTALVLFTKGSFAEATAEFEANGSEISKALRNQGLSIMKQIAPINKPGFVDAHLFLAKKAMYSEIQSARDRTENVQIATAHLDNAIILDQENVTAFRLKSVIAQQAKDFDETKVFVEKIFETDVFVYPELCRLNDQLGKSNENLTVLHGALKRLSGEISRMTGSSERRTRYATYLVDCHHRLENVDAADRAIEKEVTKFPDNESVQRWSKRLLAIGQELRYRTAERINAKNEQELLGYLREGHRLDPTNQRILEHLVKIQNSTIPGVAKASKAIYQPDSNAPPSIENLLGKQALSRGDNLEAIKRISKASSKDPNNAEYLNNLAYLYLTGPNPNPQQALNLVDKAIVISQRNQFAKKLLTFLYDTKGEVMLALGKIAEEEGKVNVANSRYAAATALHLKALTDRPNDIKIVKRIVQCYEAAGRPEQVKVWTARMKQLQAAQGQ